MKLEMPWPPSINGYKGVFNGRIILAKKGREYKELVSLTVKPERKLTGRVIMEVTLHPPTKARVDIDNRMKALLDGLTLIGAYEDDSQIDKLIINRGIVIKGGKVEIEMKEVEGCQFDEDHLNAIRSEGL